MIKKQFDPLRPPRFPMDESAGEKPGGHDPNGDELDLVYEDLRIALALNAELVAALEKIYEYASHAPCTKCPEIARAALAKVKGDD